jgi:hypothetical protein
MRERLNLKGSGWYRGFSIYPFKHGCSDDSNNKPAISGGFGLEAVNWSPSLERLVFSRLPTDNLRSDL